MKLGDTNAAAFMVNRSAATVRKWAERGYLTRHGHDKHGRTLYDLEQVQAVAKGLREPGSADPQRMAGNDG